MARPNTTEREASRTQNTSNTNTISNTGSSSTRSANATRTSSDEERSIRTAREQGARPASDAARRQTGSVRSTYDSNPSPFALMRRMADDMDRIFSDFGFGRPSLGLSPIGGLDQELWRGARDIEAAWTPQVETFRRGDQFVVRADLPGLKKEDVNVEVDDGMLAISGERCDEHEENRDDYYRSERSYGTFYRAIPLPDGVAGDQCSATFKDGVLEVTLAAPKQEQKRKRQVEIR
jgi:HSP20 family protein